MKELFKRPFLNAFSHFFKLKFKRISAGLDPRSLVYLVDIDNTLADTWPSLRDRVYGNDCHRYRSLSVFMGMREYLLREEKKGKIIFISARAYLNYRTTEQWLQSCGLGRSELILVAEAVDKIYYIKALLKKGVELVYIDDLSYNHEHGEMKLYEELISVVNDLPLTYLGIKEIESINSNDGFSAIEKIRYRDENINQST